MKGVERSRLTQFSFAIKIGEANHFTCLVMLSYCFQIRPSVILLRGSVFDETFLGNQAGKKLRLYIMIDNALSL
jgi:hypothetical protein